MLLVLARIGDPLGWLSELSFMSHQIRSTITSLSVFEMQ